MDHFFRGSDVRLAEKKIKNKFGEMASQYSDLIYGPSVESINIYGRKLIILSNMAMMFTATPNLGSSQQCKKLQVNEAILDSLQRPSPRKTMAMDWIGHIGYMFAIISLNNIYHHFINSRGQDAHASLSQRKNLDRLCFIYDSTDTNNSRMNKG
ncbi:hypothetical protein BDC45DRAFT_544206 [Circinella umbellata]|nr:hypothetical protein BDC45DRAFT_544206 [Circinella umbellata]